MDEHVLEQRVVELSAHKREAQQFAVDFGGRKCGLSVDLHDKRLRGGGDGGARGRGGSGGAGAGDGG